MTPYACNNTPRADGHWMVELRVSPPMDRLDSAQVLHRPVFIKDAMTKDCQYRKAVTSDPRCDGCVK